MKSSIIIRFTVVCVFVVMAFGKLQAQEKAVRLGMYLAPNVSWLAPDAQNYESNGASLGFVWGLMADFTMMEHYYISTGFKLNYFKGGLTYPDMVSDNEGKMARTYNLRYLTVPFMIKMKTNELVPNTKFYGTMGLELGVRVRAKANDVFTASQLTEKNDKVDIEDNTQAVMAALVVGGGAEITLDESLHLLTGVSFHNGLINVLDGKNAVDGKIEHRAIPYYFSLDIALIF